MNVSLYTFELLFKIMLPISFLYTLFLGISFVRSSKKK